MTLQVYADNSNKMQYLTVKCIIEFQSMPKTLRASNHLTSYELQIIASPSFYIFYFDYSYLINKPIWISSWFQPNPTTTRNLIPTRPN